MTEFDAALSSVAALDEDALGRPWSFRGQMMDVRYALYRTIEDAQEVHVRLVGRSLPESRRILLVRAAGVRRPARPPRRPARRPHRPSAARGEWPVREVLRHMWVVERRYALQTLYALERADSDPVRIADHRLPTAAQMDATGASTRSSRGSGEARAESNRRPGDVAPALMTRPTIWARYDVDVRFRLHRFAAHVIEHTIQCEKALAALGWQPTEGRHIARQFAALVGEIEGLGAHAEAREIEHRLAERWASATPA